MQSLKSVFRCSGTFSHDLVLAKYEPIQAPEMLLVRKYGVTSAQPTV